MAPCYCPGILRTRGDFCIQQSVKAGLTIKLCNPTTTKPRNQKKSFSHLTVSSGMCEGTTRTYPLEQTRTLVKFWS